MNDQTPAPKPVRTKRQRRLLRANTIIFVLLIVAIVTSVVFYTKYRHSQNTLKHPEIIARTETQQLVTKVGRHVDLPAGEQPTVATVSDVSKLANQTFFANAKNGDKVLIYGKAKKAVLYRPSEDKVINVAPLNTGT